MDINKPKRVDFRVKYRFFSRDEGGRESGPPFNNYRSDWLYEGDDIQRDGLSMVWPFFEDENGNFIDRETRVSKEGIASMFILVPESRADIHRKRINVGVRGYFMEGSKRVAEAEVIEIVELHSEKI